MPDANSAALRYAVERRLRHLFDRDPAALSIPELNDIQAIVRYGIDLGRSLPSEPAKEPWVAENR